MESIENYYCYWGGRLPTLRQEFTFTSTLQELTKGEIIPRHRTFDASAFYPYFESFLHC